MTDEPITLVRRVEMLEQRLIQMERGVMWKPQPSAQTAPGTMTFTTLKTKDN